MLHPIRTAALALALVATAGSALAQEAFSGLDRDFHARLRGGAAGGQGALVAGAKGEISARGLAPGQTMTLRLNGVALNDGEVYAADDKGEATAEIMVPAGAAPGTWPVVAEFAAPAWSAVVDLKVSPVLPDKGVDGYRFVSRALEGGLYEVAYSAAQDSLYVSAASGRGTTTFSAIYKLDPQTLETRAQATPPAAPARDDGRPAGLIGVFGLTVSDADGQVWATNTRQNSIAVYDAADLTLIKQFPVDTVAHPRGVVVHDGRAYVGEVFKPDVAVFDTATLEKVGEISIDSSLRGKSFGVGGMALDATGGRLLVSSIATGEVAVIDLASGQVTGVHATPSAGTAGIGFDAAANHALLPGQETDDLSIVDLATGETLRTVSVGANPLNAMVEPVSGLTFVAVRLADRLAVLSPEGELIANLPTGSRPNQIAADGEGAVFLVNKSAGPDDDQGDQITRISPAR